CLLRMSRPVRLTLFPYTTLFRSRCVEESDSLVAAPRARDNEMLRGAALARATRHGQRTRFTDTQAQHSRRSRPLADFRLLRCAEDRKSTRLNSSHQIISYAVFCL